MNEKYDLRELSKITKSWEKENLEPNVSKDPERDTVSLTDIGVKIKGLYTPLDLAECNFDYIKDLGFPGQEPFTRGITPSMYRSRPWIIRAYSGFGEAEECNERYKKLLEVGVDEIAIALDLPSQMGYDSDHIMAKGEVGKVGVAIDTLRDLELLFKDIPLNKLRRVSMLGNSFGPIALAFFLALGEKQGLRPTDFVVDLQNDVLKEYVARGTYIFPIAPAVRIATDVVGYCARNIPHWYPMTFCSNHINASGAGSSKATAFAMANGICYIEHLLTKGYDIDEIAPLFSMFLDERSDFFVAISNFRASRRIWSRIMKEKFGANAPKSLALKTTAYSHGGETLLEPINNIARITLAALAYVLGGVQFLYNASYDEVLGTPTLEAATVSIRIQQILAQELGISNTVDPLGGSYFVETLTKRIDDQITAELEKIEQVGGAIKAIETGYYTFQMTEGAMRRKTDFDSGKKIAIGVNKFRQATNMPSGAFTVNPLTESKQCERLRKVKQERDTKSVRNALEYLTEVAKSEGNLVPAALEAVRSYATIGEMCDALKQVFGEFESKEYYFKKR